MAHRHKLDYPALLHNTDSGDVKKIIHYHDLLKCDHGGKVNLDPTLERETEISSDLRIVTDNDLLQRVTITGCSVPCSKIVSITTGLADNVELKGGAIPVVRTLVAVTDKGCKVKYVGSFDVDKAVSTLDKNAPKGSKSDGWCAAYVKAAIEDGGMPKIPGGNAEEFGTNISQYGFSSVATEADASFSPQKGDVIVFPGAGTHTDGHTAMYNGSNWVSDFNQNGKYVWRDQQNPPYTIYRADSNIRSKGNQAHAKPK